MDKYNAVMVTTQAHEGIETIVYYMVWLGADRNNSSPWGHWNNTSRPLVKLLVVTTQAHEGIETRSVQYTFAITRVPVPVPGKKV